MRTIFFLFTLLCLSEASAPRPVLAHSLLVPAVASSQTSPLPAPLLLAANTPSREDIAKDLVVTSDSKAYCQRLDEDLTSLVSQPHNVPVNTMEDARILQTQGEALCDHGHIRAGIERLRRALVMLKKYGGPKK